MGDDYEDKRLVVQTSDGIEEKIRECADRHDVRIPRARRQLIEKGLAVEDAELPPMTGEEEEAFLKRLERLRSIVEEKSEKR